MVPYDKTFYYIYQDNNIDFSRAILLKPGYASPIDTPEQLVKFNKVSAANLTVDGGVISLSDIISKTCPYS